MKHILILFILFNFSYSQSYFEEVGKHYDIDPILLYSIAKTESNFDPNAVNCSNNNGSCDFGIMQINSIHLPFLAKQGITQKDLFEPKINVLVGAWVLKKCMNKHGFSYKALNCYNGKINNNDYYNRVFKSYKHLLSLNETIASEKK